MMQMSSTQCLYNGELLTYLLVFLCHQADCRTHQIAKLLTYHQRMILYKTEETMMVLLSHRIFSKLCVKLQALGLRFSGPKLQTLGLRFSSLKLHLKLQAHNVPLGWLRLQARNSHLGCLK